MALVMANLKKRGGGGGGGETTMLSQRVLDFNLFIISGFINLTPPTPTSALHMLRTNKKCQTIVAWNLWGSARVKRRVTYSVKKCAAIYSTV